MPFFLNKIIDFSMSPFVSSITSLQSLNPTPVISLKCFTFSNKLSCDIKIFIFYFAFLEAKAFIFDKIDVDLFLLLSFFTF